MALMIYPFILLLGDFFALMAAFTLAYILRVTVDSDPLIREIPAIDFIRVFLLLFPIWLLINGLLGLYSKPIYERRLPEFGRLIVGSLLGILFIIGYDFVIDTTIFPARLVPVYGFLLALFLLALVRNGLWFLRRYLFRYGYGIRGVMIIGNTHATENLAQTLSNTLGTGYAVRAIVSRSNPLPDHPEVKHFTSLNKALRAIHKIPLHTVFQTQMYDSEKTNARIFEAVRNHHLQYKFIPAQSEFYTGKNTVDTQFGYPIISVHQTSLVGWGRIVKRIIDVLLSLIILIPALPVMLVLAAIIKITDPEGPVFYLQKRYTRFGNEFYIYKLRSMYWKYSSGEKANNKTAQQIFKEMGRDDLVKEYEEHFKVQKDPRITPIGKFIRATSLDELPQLFNILLGHISFVGPRAKTKEEIERYRKQAGGDIVLSVKSGLTGLAQVEGRSDLSPEEKLRLDLYYVQNWSMWLDLKILLRTIVVVIRRSGAV